jgi:hypothetical protein
MRRCRRCRVPHSDRWQLRSTASGPLMLYRNAFASLSVRWHRAAVGRGRLRSGSRRAGVPGRRSPGFSAALFGHSDREADAAALVHHVGAQREHTPRMSDDDPGSDPVPAGLVVDLDEAFRVLKALEDARLALRDVGAAPGLQDELATVIRLLHGGLVFDEGEVCSERSRPVVACGGCSSSRCSDACDRPGDVREEAPSRSTLGWNLGHPGRRSGRVPGASTLNARRRRQCPTRCV